MDLCPLRKQKLRHLNNLPQVTVVVGDKSGAQVCPKPNNVPRRYQQPHCPSTLCVSKAF